MLLVKRGKNVLPLLEYTPTLAQRLLVGSQSATRVIAESARAVGMTFSTAIVSRATAITVRIMLVYRFIQLSYST
jgi:hypothetical protein